MAQGSIKTRHAKDRSVRYDAIVDLGVDPITGKRRQRKKTFTKKREAQAQLTSWQNEVNKGTAVDRSKQTVGEIMEYWLDTFARHNVRPGTLEGYERSIRTHIVPALGTIPIQKLAPTDLQQFYSDKIDAGCGTRTLQLCHLRLSQALKQAVRLGLVQRNVADFVACPRSTPKESKTWDAAQVRRFLTVTDQSVYGPIWLISAATGMRRGELLGLRWQDIDFDHNVLHIRQAVTAVGGAPHVGPPKSKSSQRPVTVPKDVLIALRNHKRLQNEQRLVLGELWEDHDLVFPAAKGTYINPNNLTRDYNRLVALADVPRIRIHDQRHTHVTLALASGAPLAAVSKRVGHARTSITTDIYAHVLPEQDIEVSDRMGALLFGTLPQLTAEGSP